MSTVFADKKIQTLGHRIGNLNRPQHRIRTVNHTQVLCLICKTSIPACSLPSTLPSGLIVDPRLKKRGRVVRASDLRSGGRGFDSRPCHVAIALGKRFTLTFPSPPTCKTGTWLKAVLEICGMLTFERLTGCHTVML
ncbi:hypothetical protein ElyMa_004669800 [Elysia marginata]|uniref:Uncharacterized protein n=1 Tax=Elysia marginata TaxID=1093978 RepID=A0AAV4I5Y4_9GAST|nr:hypothetical protein ElyMa_004669800 [Elysia marginata]